MLKVTVKRFDTTLPVPEYKTAGAAGMDLYAREDTVVPAHGIAYVPLNIALQLPEGTWLLMSARSSLHKKGVMMANGIGVGDYDYRGDGDEYKAALYNFTEHDALIERGERIVQMIVMERTAIEFTELPSFDTKDRGGFGSTGSK
jgi:dUTP pyrophosphatase